MNGQNWQRPGGPHWQREFHRARAAWPIVAALPGQFAQANLRIGDAERDRAISALGDHFAAGRLNHEEYDQRTAAVVRATTYGELVSLFHDLPNGYANLAAAPPQPRPRRVTPFLPLVLIGLGLLMLTGKFAVFLLVLGLALLLQWKLRQNRNR